MKSKQKNRKDKKKIVKRKMMIDFYKNNIYIFTLIQNLNKLIFSLFDQ